MRPGKLGGRRRKAFALAVAVDRAPNSACCHLNAGRTRKRGLLPCGTPFSQVWALQGAAARVVSLALNWSMQPSPSSGSLPAACAVHRHVAACAAAPSSGFARLPSGALSPQHMHHDCSLRSPPRMHQGVPAGGAVPTECMRPLPAALAWRRERAAESLKGILTVAAVDADAHRELGSQVRTPLPTVWSAPHRCAGHCRRRLLAASAGASRLAHPACPT